MILPVLIIIIIMLMYVNVYFCHGKNKPNSRATKRSLPCHKMQYAQPTEAAMHMQTHQTGSPQPHVDYHAEVEPRYRDIQYDQEQSRRTRDDSYGSDPRSKEEYMTNKYSKSYMQAVVTPPSASNYNEYMISTGLEAGVVSSHKEFTDETHNKTTGASAETVFSHDDSVVPSWGLRRRSANIPINPNSREVPSQTNEQLADNTQEFKYGLF